LESEEKGIRLLSFLRIEWQPSLLGEKVLTKFILGKPILSVQNLQVIFHILSEASSIASKQVLK
jgi:hypothetical protein